MIQPVSFSGSLSERLSRAVRAFRDGENACVSGLNRDSLFEINVPESDVFIIRNPKGTSTNGPCLGREMIQTIMDFKAHMASILNANSIAELPQKGIIRIGVVIPEPDSTSDKDVALDVLVDSNKYLWVKGKVPHSFNGYDVYMHQASPHNPPIT